MKVVLAFLGIMLFVPFLYPVWYPEHWAGPLTNPNDEKDFLGRVRAVDRLQYIDPARSWQWYDQLLQEAGNNPEYRLRLGLAYAVPRMVRDGRDAALESLAGLEGELNALESRDFWRGRLSLAIGDVNNRSGYLESASKAYRSAERYFFRSDKLSWQSLAILRQVRMRFHAGPDVGVSDQLQQILEMEGACPSVQAFAKVLLVKGRPADLDNHTAGEYARARNRLQSLTDPIATAELLMIDFGRAIRMGGWIVAESVLLEFEEFSAFHELAWYRVIARLQRLSLELSFGQSSTARTMYQSLPADVSSVGWQGSLGLMVATLGEWALAHGELEFAEQAFTDARSFAPAEMMLYLEPDLHWGMSQIARARGNFVEAYEHYTEFKRASDRRLNSLMSEQLDLREEELKQERMQLALVIQETQLEQAKRIRNLTVMGLALAFVIVVMLWMRLRLLRVSRDNLRLAIEKEQLARQHALAAQQAAEDANQLKSEFLSNISHEVKTPLNALIGMISVLQEMPAASSEQKRCLETIQTCSDRLSKLLNDIIDLGRMESGRFELDWRPFAPAKTLNSCVEMLRPAAMAKNLEMRVEGLESLPERAVGDADRISQVILNLLGNAIKFTDCGFVRLGLKFEATENSGGWLVIEIEDSGIGIQPEQRERIFKPFEQGDKSSTRRHEGSGLGLAICGHLVRMMGGEIDFSSKPGGGSVFHTRIRLH